MGSKKKKTIPSIIPKTIPKPVIWPETFNWACLVLLAVITFLVYAQVLNSKFVFDDYVYVVNNPAIRDLSNFKAIGNTAAIAQPTRYVVIFSFALNYFFSQLNVFAYHLTNVLIHILTAFIVFWFVRLLFSTPRLSVLAGQGRRDMVACLAALLFAVHPVETQAVSYISQRCESLAVCFYVLSLCAYLKARLASASYRCGLWFVATALAALLAMFSKETAITLPLMLFFVEGFFFQYGKKNWLSGVALWKVWVGGAVVLAFTMIIPAMFSFDFRGFFFNQTMSQSHEGEKFLLWEYLLTQFRVAVVFLRLFLVPLGQNFDYDFSVSRTFFDLAMMGSFLILSAVLAIAIRFRRYQGGLVSFGIFWFFLTFLPNLVPRSNVIFEHKLYLLSIGLCIALAALFYDIFRGNVKRFVIAGFLLVAVFSVFTYQRNHVWRDELSLWDDVVKKSPGKSRTLNGLGIAYHNRGDDESALKYLNQALEQNSQNPEARNNRGIIYRDRGLFDQALEEFNASLKVWPDYVAALNNRGTLYQKKGRYDEALLDFNRALELNPTYPEILFNRADLYKKTGRADLAQKDYDRVIAMNPANSDGYNNRGIIYAEQKQFDRALLDFEMAAKLGKGSAKAYNNMGSVAFLQGQYSKAVDFYTKALEVEREYPDAIKNRAAAYRSLGDMVSALRDCSSYLAIQPADGAVYYDRSLIYHAMGDRAKAYEDAMKARSLGININDAYLMSLKSFLDGIKK